MDGQKDEGGFWTIGVSFFKTLRREGFFHIRVISQLNFSIEVFGEEE